VVEGEMPETGAVDSAWPALVTVLVLWSFASALAMSLGLSWYLWPIVLLVVSVVLAVIGRASSGNALFGMAMFVGWLAIGIAEAAKSFGAVATTHLVPMVAVITYGFMSRSLRLRDAQDLALAVEGVVRAAPLVGPVVLLVLFLPALSDNVWQVAVKLDVPTLVVVGALTVGLLLVVVRRQLGQELEPVLRDRAERLSDEADRAERTRAQARLGLDEQTAAVLDGVTDDILDRAWPAAGEEYAAYLTAAEAPSLHRPLTARLGITIIVVGVLLGAYVFVLCTAVVPVSLVSEWTGSAVPSTSIDVFGASITISGGPYVKLAALLGLAATATFLSFAVVEERFATALTDALIRKPTDRLLVLALPYVALREQAVVAHLAQEADQLPSSS
jgi:MFS family permease